MAISSFRMILRNRQGRTVEEFRAPQIINSDSVVLISVSEAALADEAFTPEALIESRFVGAADVSIHNISPSDGRVDFVLLVQWDSPLNVVTDIAILDPPIQTVLGGGPVG